MIKAARVRKEIEMLEEVLSLVDRNETENSDFEALSKELKEGDWDSDPSSRLAVQVVIHLLNRLRRLEQRMRDIEGD